jgi:hypothetical protein
LKNLACVYFSTFDTIIYSTFQACAVARGLLQDDKIWMETLQEAILITTDIQKLRLLFVMILIFGNPTEPGKLWEAYKECFTSDILYREKIRINDQNLQFDQSMFNLSLFYINEILATYNQSLQKFAGMLLIPADFSPESFNINLEEKRFIREETAYNRETLREFADTCVKRFNKEQLTIYNQIIYGNSSESQFRRMYFVNGPGGTGKTFLYNTILAKKRSEGKIAVAVATSGIAANLLDGGKTAHSIFRIPIQTFIDSTCKISPDSDLAQMIRECDCIIWDEAVMAHKYIFMAVNRTLCDIMGSKNESLRTIPFGNKQILFGGDFRQILPVVKNGNRSAIVNASIKKAKFWRFVKRFDLIDNMRIKTAAINNGVETAQLDSFSKFLISIGEGLQPIVPNSKFIDEIQLPSEITKNMDEYELIKSIYPDILTNSLDGEFMSTRAILASKNKDVNRINDIVSKYFPG